MSVVGRSPFEYLLNAPAGGGVATAFQEGEAAASRQATEASMRAESALRQREAGLKISELQAEAPLRAAERQRMLGLYQDEGEAPAARLPGSQFNVAAPGAAPGGQPRLPGAAGFIAGFEGFRNEPYYDVNAYRVGFGSDTITRPDGTVVRVAPGMTVTPEDAQRDLIRRINTEFTPRAQRAVGADTWSSLPAPVQEALVSVAYNYGSLPQRLSTAAKTGNPEQIAAAIEALAGDNEGVNRQRRLAEAAHVRSAITAQAAPQAQARPPVSLPAGALGEGFLRSPAGVPMTVSEADLPPTTGAQAQAGLGQSGTAQTPSGATVQVPGVPGAPPVVDSAGFFPGTEPIPGGWQMVGPLEALQQGALALRTSTPRSPPVAPTPVATTGGAMYAAPSQLTLGGATAIVPAGLSPAMGGGTPLGGAISPTSMAAQSQGLLTPRPTAAPAAAPATAQAALPATIPGLTVAGPAMLGLQQVQEQRAQLQRQYDRVRLAPPGERAALRAQIEAQNNALVQQERNYQVDIAVGQLSMGQWQPISNILQQMYGVQVRPVESGGRVAGYELMQDGRAVARLTPEQLGSQARLGLSQTFAQQEAARNQAKFETELKGLEEAMKQEARMTAEVVIESARRKYPDMKVEKINDETIYVYDNRGNQTMMTLSDRDERGEKLPKGSPKRWVATRMQTGQVPVR